MSDSAIVLRWNAVAAAPGYEVELRTADPAGDLGPVPIAHQPEGALVEGLDPATPYTFRVRAVNTQGATAWSAPASATTEGEGGPCVGGPTTLCLLDGRFEVATHWRVASTPVQHGVAAAQPAPGSGRTGVFTFFDPANVELVVKMLDGRQLNDSYSAFYGALSDVEYWVTVRDAVGGASRTYHNAAGELCGRGDTRAFVEKPEATGGPSSLTTVPVRADRPRRSRRATAAAPEDAAVPCATAEALCLAGGRFRVEVDWETAEAEGAGQVFRGLESDQSGHFWFFDADNLELSVKILDGRAVNDHFWLFWGALSDVGYTIRVTDTETGESFDFENPAGTLCGGAEVDAL